MPLLSLLRHAAAITPHTSEVAAIMPPLMLCLRYAYAAAFAVCDILAAAEERRFSPAAAMLITLSFATIFVIAAITLLRCYYHCCC